MYIKAMIMFTFRQTILLLFAVVLLAGACSSSRPASNKKRRKMAPCDCPKFNYVPFNDPDKTFLVIA